MVYFSQKENKYIVSNNSPSEDWLLLGTVVKIQNEKYVDIFILKCLMTDIDKYKTRKHSEISIVKILNALLKSFKNDIKKYVTQKQTYIGLPTIENILLLSKHHPELYYNLINHKDRLEIINYIDFLYDNYIYIENDNMLNLIKLNIENLDKYYISKDCSDKGCLFAVLHNIKIT